MFRVIPAAVAAVVAAGAAGAQEFKGAEISSEVLAYTDNSDLGETEYRGSLEFGVFGGFGIQADLSFHDSRTVDFGSRTFTLHALYDAFEFGTVGAFFSRDAVEVGGIEGDIDLYGVEGGRSFGAAGVEAYVGVLDGEGLDGQMLGVEGAYDFGRNLSVIGSADILMSDDDAQRFAIGAAYRFGDGGPSVYAKVGHLNLQSGGQEAGETFVSLGAKISLGPNDGTTFGGRGVFEVLSGF